MSRTGLERFDDEGIIERQCAKCHDWWPLDFFSVNSKCLGGRTRECKACRQERRRGHAKRSQKARRASLP
jgi:hypothetical protein